MMPAADQRGATRPPQTPWRASETAPSVCASWQLSQSHTSLVCYELGTEKGNAGILKFQVS